MIFNRHDNLAGKHAFLSASQYHWLKDDQPSLFKRYQGYYASSRGTKIHNLAKKLIDQRIRLTDSIESRDLVLFYLLDDEKDGIKIPRSVIDVEQIFPTLMAYVNDGIGFGMAPEVVLYHSDICFGTADTIHYAKNSLRVHDLKTGISPVSFNQLKIYAALFFLEYKKKVEKTDICLRIYQNGEIMEYRPDKEEILEIMDKIISNDNFIKTIIESEG